MVKIGLTGGIGSGKSLVADFFAEWGAAVIDTDQIAHELTQAGGAAMLPIRQAFGPDVISPDGALNRAAMRELVFADPAQRAKLEAIIHPLIASETERQAASAVGCYQVFVVPLLVESGRWRDKVDRICVVDCEPETQIARVKSRSGLTTEVIGRIMSAQATRAARLAVADDVVDNGASVTFSQLKQRALELHHSWCGLTRQQSQPTAFIASSH
ncbi:MAG: dephospho-CoA kinase [Burkholderiaceae bacterium]|nr:dephospho-CoA kinase [Burkholderiaceae bacterium]